MSSNRYEPTSARRGHPFDYIPDLPCRNADPDLFFPKTGATAKPGKDICAVCPIEVECLAWALVSRQVFGTWGGVTAKARAMMTPAEQTVIIRAARPFDSLIPETQP